MPASSVTLHFTDEENAPTLRTCLEQLLQNLSQNPEEGSQDEPDTAGQ